MNIGDEPAATGTIVQSCSAQIENGRRGPVIAHGVNATCIPDCLEEGAKTIDIPKAESGIAQIGCRVKAIALLQQTDIQPHNSAFIAIFGNAGLTKWRGLPAGIIGHSGKDTLIEVKEAIITKGAINTKHDIRATAIIMGVSKAHAVTKFMQQGDKAKAALLKATACRIRPACACTIIEDRNALQIAKYSIRRIHIGQRANG